MKRNTGNYLQGIVIVNGKQMMKYFSIIIMFIFLLAQASYAVVSEQSNKLENLRKAVENGHGIIAEKEYLNCFPATFEKFKRTFYGRENKLDELYPTHYEHLDLLAQLHDKYPDKVVSIWLGVATNGHWDADAIGLLQHQLANYGATNTKQFSMALLSKSSNQRQSIVTFLADVENHSAYKDYQKIMNNLKTLGYNELFNIFDAAKKARIRKHDH